MGICSPATSRLAGRLTTERPEVLEAEESPATG